MMLMMSSPINQGSKYIKPPIKEMMMTTFCSKVSVEDMSETRLLVRVRALSNLS